MKSQEWKLMFETADGWIQRNILPDTNVFWLRFLEQAFDAAIEFEQWGKAIEWGARIIPAYKLFYGTEHPFLGLHLMKFSKVLIKLENREEVEEMLRVSEQILVILYDSYII
jgi:SET and MYND domain-containing protein